MRILGLALPLDECLRAFERVASKLDRLKEHVGFEPPAVHPLPDEGHQLICLLGRRRPERSRWVTTRVAQGGVADDIRVISGHGETISRHRADKDRHRVLDRLWDVFEIAEAIPNIKEGPLHLLNAIPGWPPRYPRDGEFPAHRASSDAQIKTSVTEPIESSCLPCQKRGQPEADIQHVRPQADSLRDRRRGGQHRERSKAPEMVSLRDEVETERLDPLGRLS